MTTASSFAARRALAALFAFLAAVAVVACRRGEDGAPTEVPATWTVARQTAGHRAHLGKRMREGDAERAIVCADCHGKDSKDFTATPEPCARCHDAEEKRHHRGSKDRPTPCTSCHGFRPTRDGSLATPACVDCHRADGVDGKLRHPHHVEARATCGACHSAHGEPEIVQGDCTGCHTGIGVRHGARVVSQADPDAGADALAERAWEAGAAHVRADAGADGAGADAVRVCTSCHAPHAAAKTAVAGCPSCHVEGAQGSALPADLADVGKQAPKVRPRGPGVAGHTSCTECHLPHQASKDAVRPCVGCHEKKRAVTLVKGHAECKGCHAPHAPLEAAGACGSCHQNHLALGAPKAAPHARCSSCHDVHAPTASPAAACETCHAAVHPTHPAALAKSGKSLCVGCHAPHPTTPTATVRPCTSCHQAVAKSDAAAHATATCASCHQQHEGFKLAGQVGTICKTCHQAQASKVRQGHADCRSCHGGPHAPTRKVACGKCHPTEASTAPKGHAACASCHEHHAGALVVGGGKKGDDVCASCHADKPKAVHGAIPQGCAGCHRPHGPKGPASVPACLTCHATSKLGGLHAKPAHRGNCQSCHGGHAPPAASRTTCTGSCHADRQGHQPDATSCKGCHTFKL